MNRDVFEGQWKQVRGRAKQWWGKLTDDELDRVEGHYDEMVGLLQKRYGYSRERAEEEVEQRLSELEGEAEPTRGRY